MFRRATHRAGFGRVALLVALLASCSAGSSFAASLKDDQPSRDSALAQAASSKSPRTTGAQPAAVITPRFSVDRDYRLSAGDVVQIVVFNEPTLSTAARIGPGGSIPMPLLGQVGLRGMSLREAEAFLVKRLSTLVRKPSVTVTVDEISSIRKVYVSGELSRNGAVTLPFGSTLTDAVAAAGPGPYADLRRVRLTHPGGKPIDVDCSGLRGEGGLGHEHRVEYGDTVYVPRVREEVMILGEVQAPGSLLLPVDREVRVLDALRMSQGFSPIADRSRAILLRADADPLEIDLEALLKGGSTSQNHVLQGGDVLVVHEAGSISVVGQVNTPQVFRMGTPIPVLQGLAAAGGPTATADLSRAEIIRAGKSISVDLQRFIEAGQAPEESSLLPGDVLVIPEGVSQTLLVMGALGRTGTFNLRGVTERDLLRIITTAGPGPGSDLTRVTIYRGKETLVRNLQALMDDGDLSQNLDLQPGDMVMVPPREIDSVLVTGAVSRQGVLQIARDEDHDLLRIVTISGPGIGSNLKRVTIHRDGETIIRDLKAAVDDGRMENSLLVEDGDVIVVPEIDENVVLSGAIERGGIIRLVDDDWRDLGRLILMSGPLPYADLTRVMVSRGGKQTQVNVKPYIEEGNRAATLALEDGDMIRVPVVEDSIMLTGALSRGGVLRLVPTLDRDLASLILAAGPMPQADLEHVTVHRGQDKIVRNLLAMIQDGDRTQSMYVEPGDIITVPARELRNILITGAVAQAGLLTVADDPRRDLARLVTLAGPLPNADLTRVKVHRGGSTTERDIKAFIDTGLEAYSLQLEDGDVVVVPRVEHTVLVMGAVARYGSIQLFDDKQRDLMRVVTLAGPMPNANLAKVTIFRGEQQIERDLEKLYETGDLSQSFLLEDGDIIKVPAYEDSVLLAGAAGRTGVLALGDKDTRDLARLVAASGPAAFADLRRVTVHRGGEKITRDVQAYLYEGDTSQTLQLEDGDLVVIPIDRGTALITGAVQRAGQMRVSDPENRRLVDTVLASGPLPNADLKRVTVFRGEEQFVYNLEGLVEEGVPVPADAEVLPGDRILVPGLDTVSVLVTGAVQRRGTIELVTEEQRDLARVVTASGWDPMADLTNVTVHRGDEVIVRNLRAYFDQGDTSQTLLLEDGDRVLVPQLGTGSIIITGQVMRSGVVPQEVGRSNDLFATVTLAGPNRPTADLSRVTVYRKGEKIVRDLTRLEEEGDTSQNIMLEPGDIVHVPMATETVVFAGEVARPGALSIHGAKERDLVRLLPLASPNPEGGLDRVTIYREGEAIVRNYRALVEEGDMTQNIELQPGDLVYVPADDVNNIMVLGALQRNGAVNIRDKANRDLLRVVTLMQPLATADLTRVTVYRPDQEPIYRDLRLLQDEGALDQTMDLQPGDVVVVPAMDEIYVLGAVGRPGPYPLDPEWGIMDIVSRAALTQGAQQRVIMIRKRPDGTTEHTEINLARLRQGKVPDPVKVKPGDIFYVPPRAPQRGDLWRTLRDSFWIVSAVVNLFD